MVQSEAGPRQEVLRLEAKDAAHLDRVDQPLLLTVGMGDVVDELASVHLAGQISLEHAVATDDRAPIRQGERRLLIGLGTARIWGLAPGGTIVLVSAAIFAVVSVVRGTTHGAPIGHN